MTLVPLLTRGATLRYISLEPFARSVAPRVSKGTERPS
jgi:hypothetical protein